MNHHQSSCNDLENRSQGDLNEEDNNNGDTGGPDTKAALNYAKYAPFAGQAALEQLEKLQTLSLLTMQTTNKSGGNQKQQQQQQQQHSQKQVKEEQVIVLSLQKSDIRIESGLGQGSYASVFLVAVPKLGSQPQYNDDDHMSEVSIDFSKHGSPLDDSHEHSVKGLFAMKRLLLDYKIDANNKDTTKLHDEKEFIKAASDLVNEAFLLSHLQHENLVQLRGVAAGGNIIDSIHAAFQQPGGYFLVMEALERPTLDVRLHQWRGLDNVRRQGRFFSFNKKEKKKNSGIPSSQDRIFQMALPICKGMEYLHQRHVILRNLKPHHIGFGQDGKIKILDLGLAREVPPIPGQHKQDVMIQGTAGSPRYIAPENILGDGCFFSGDVYSFGVLLWELLSLDVAFEKMSSSTYQVEVAVEGYRPSIRRVGSIPKSVKVLIQDCWDEDRSVRPTFSEVREVLESVQQKQRGEDHRPRLLGRMFRLPGSSRTTKTKMPPLEAVSSAGIGPSKQRKVQKAPSEMDLTNTEGD